MPDPEIINDAQWLLLREQIAAGDQQAFRQLFNSYITRLAQFSFAIVKNREASLDIVNGVFIKIWKQKERITGISNIQVYLYTAIKNASLNYLSQKAHQHITEPFDHIDVQLNAGLCPDQQMITAEIFNEIHEAVEALPPRCKMIFKLVREDGLRYRDVAEILNISVNTVDAQMVIAVKRISEKVKKHFDFTLRLSSRKTEP